MQCINNNKFTYKFIFKNGLKLLKAIYDVEVWSKVVFFEDNEIKNCRQCKKKKEMKEEEVEKRSTT